MPFYKWSRFFLANYIVYHAACCIIFQKFAFKHRNVAFIQFMKTNSMNSTWSLYRFYTIEVWITAKSKVEYWKSNDKVYIWNWNIEYLRVKNRLYESQIEKVFTTNKEYFHNNYRVLKIQIVMDCTVHLWQSSTSWDTGFFT